MSEELFLILHKVRGEPAFDIATCIGEDSDGEIWIIPTSGHRAYPYQSFLLDDLYQDLETNSDYPEPLTQILKPMPDNWPDHYTITDKAEYGHREVRKSAVSDLLRAIGHAKPSLIRRTVKP